jgi:oligoribonuclease
MIDKNAIPTKVLWVDLEMTGLDSEQDVILEIAAEITDFNFKTLASYEAIVKQPKQLVADRMQKNTWWADYPENRDEFMHKMDSDASKPSDQVQQELVALIEEQFGNEAAVLGGNSIHSDRGFIKHWWPELDLKLHYRMLDVSSLKIIMQGKYGVQFEKNNSHRAFDDIQASIAELQFYLEWFRKLDSE